MIDSTECEYIQSNKDIAGDNSQLYIRSSVYNISVLNDISTHEEDLEVIVNSSMKRQL